MPQTKPTECGPVLSSGRTPEEAGVTARPSRRRIAETLGAAGCRVLVTGLDAAAASEEPSAA